ncbi:MAG: peptide deformylase [Deltaproteobacteria bacterium]|nr:peptide deformylase [Deltaproteobacteria bacterium]
MAIRKVALLGNPVLRKAAALVPERDLLGKAIQSLIQEMLETMAEYDGRGLAAPQVHESKQITVLTLDSETSEKSGILCLINPVVEPLTKETSGYWEGCLSIPGMRGLVFRPKKVLVRALNEKAERVEFVAEGFAATVVQHECDHLLGKLYIDRMQDFSLLSFEREYVKYHALAPKSVE